MKRSVRWGSTGAIVLSLAIAGQSVAASWSPPFDLAAGSGYPIDMVMAGTTAVALYADDVEASYIRRSTDGGVTWQAPVFLSSLAPGATYGYAIAAHESYVDLVFMREGRLRYRRSTDAGATFGSATTMTTLAENATSPRVAHGPGGVVAIVYGASGTVRVRVSTNNGASFPLVQTVGSADIYEPYEVALGDGVMYVAYYPEWTKLRLKRSLNGGATWGSAFNVGNNVDAFGGLDLVASGTHAYLAYANGDVRFSSVDYRRTVDRGATWSARMDLAPPTSDPSLWPHLFLRGGVLRAVYSTCVDNWDYCDPYTPWYTQTGDGFNWATRQRLLPTSFEDGSAHGVGSAGKAIVLLSGWRESDGWGVWVRRRL